MPPSITPETPCLGSNLRLVVIILSAGRTGTKALAHIFDGAFCGVRAFHEPAPSWRLRIASNAYLAGRKTDEEMTRLLIDNRSKLCSSIEEEVYVESNGLLNGFLAVLPKVFAGVKVLHVVRDPRTYVPSALNFGTRRGLKRLASDLVPFWILKPEHLSDTSRERWNRMNDLQRYSWFWRVSNEHLDRGRSLLGEAYRRSRFEDLMAEDGREIRLVADWLGLEERPGVLPGLLSKKLNASRTEDVPSFGLWLPEDRHSLLSHCEDLMMRYGYEIDAPSVL